jgi:hypothetical protein
MENLHGKRILKMIDWLVNRIFRWDPLRKAVFDEVRLYQSVDRSLWEYEKEGPTNLTWSEGDRWYGWTYNNNAKRYYFDDIGNESLMGLWEDQWLREADDLDPEKKINAWAGEQIKIAKETGEVPF